MPDIDIKQFKDINGRFHKLPPWWYDIIFPWRMCAQRILVVTDSFLDFNETNDFGLTEFLLALETAAPSGMAPIISIAHRSNNPGAASAAMQAKFTYFNNFKFENANTASALMNGTARRFDQLWLFATSGGNTLQPGEQGVIESFMNARGGVFATGDHATLGQGMCGNLLRVKNMRDWSGIPMGGMNRIDTTNFPSRDGAWDFDSQSDTLAQQTYPHFSTDVSGNFVPHPILKYGSGTSFQTDVIDVLPDHAHESECWLGVDPNLPGAAIDPAEFPVLAATGVPLAPVPVASSMSGGRIIEKGPVTPRGFIAINAYDGHQVSVGRIVCDATWHHFVNVNLDGTASSRNGLRDEVPAGSGTFVPNAAYLKIKQYYRNIAEWIGPVRWCRWYIELLVARYRFPLVEELPFIPEDPDWPCLVDLGNLVQKAIDQRAGKKGMAADMIKDMLAASPDGQSILLPEASEKTGPSLIPAQEMVAGLIGGVARAVFKGLPETPQELGKKFAKQKRLHEFGEEQIVAGLQNGLETAQSHYIALAERTISVMKERNFAVKSPN